MYRFYKFQDHGYKHVQCTMVWHIPFKQVKFNFLRFWLSFLNITFTINFFRKNSSRNGYHRADVYIHWSREKPSPSHYRHQHRQKPSALRWSFFLPEPCRQHYLVFSYAILVPWKHPNCTVVLLQYPSHWYTILRFDAHCRKTWEMIS